MNENFNRLPKDERPYERCIRHGAGQLSDRELLAVLLRTGAKGRTVLELAGDLLGLSAEKEGFTGLRRKSLEELSALRGIGKVKAWQGKKQEQAFTLGRRLPLQSIIWKICAIRNRNCFCF